MSILRQIFTAQNLVAWFVINMFFAGIAGTWIFVNVQFLGHDVSIQDPAYAMERATKHR